MPTAALLTAAFIIGLEQFVEWKYGPAGLVGLLLLTVGIKARSPMCSSAGAVTLALLMTAPAR